MSKLQDLIDSLCPNGVEFKPLGEVCNKICSGGTPLTSNKSYYNGSIPWLRTQEVDWQDVYDTEIKISEEAVKNSSAKLIPANCVIVAMYGATAAKVCINRIPLTTNQACCNLEINCSMAYYKYVYYWLCNSYEKLKAMGEGSQNNINSQKIKNFLIPIPPLPVQEEIVRILDRFSNYAAELQAELQARKEQYEYYRNLLLTFNPSACGCGTDDKQKDSVIAPPSTTYKIQWKKMGEIGTFYGGLTGKSKSDFTYGKARFISYMNVYSNIALNQEANEFVRIGENEKQNILEYGDAIFTGSSETPDECGMSSVVTKKPTEALYLNSFCFGFRLDDKSIYLPDFLKHLLRSKPIRAQIVKTANGVTRYNVSKSLFAKVILPIPPIEVQEKIVAILDRFETLVNDISKGLPAEIEAQKTRYEYYRNKLLTFKPLPA